MSSSQYQSLVTMVVDGVPWGVFESRTGGVPSGEVAKYRPGGMQKQKSRTGQRDYSDVQVARTWEEERDEPLYRSGLARTPGAEVVVTDQRLDSTGAPVGKPRTYTGTLQDLSDGDSDANSNDAKVLSATMSVLEVS